MGPPPHDGVFVFLLPMGARRPVHVLAKTKRGPTPLRHREFVAAADGVPRGCADAVQKASCFKLKLNSTAAEIVRKKKCC